MGSNVHHLLLLEGVLRILTLSGVTCSNIYTMSEKHTTHMLHMHLIGHIWSLPHRTHMACSKSELRHLTMLTCTEPQVNLDCNERVDLWPQASTQQLACSVNDSKTTFTSTSSSSITYSRASSSVGGKGSFKLVVASLVALQANSSSVLPFTPHKPE